MSTPSSSNPRGPAQRFPSSSEPITRDPKSVDQGHQNSDINSSIFAQHHSLGPNPNQASPGNHVHDGSNSKQLEPSATVDRLTWTAWTPVVNGGGSATFSRSDGWYYTIGDLAFFNAYLVASVVGSGAVVVTITLPFTPFRGGVVDRQIYSGGISGGVGAGGQLGALAAWTFAGGTVGIDRLVMSNGVDMTGAHITAASILAVQGTARIA